MVNDVVKKRLLQIIKEKAVLHSSVILSSGRVSGYYIDARKITLSAEGSYLVAKLIFDLIKDEGIDAVGGPTVGADPIVGAVIYLSYLNNSPLQGFIVRKEAKKHGLQKLIEGPDLKKGCRVVIVDDVITTGSSTLMAAKAIENLGCKVVKIIALVDRLEGGKKNLEENGFKFVSLFTVKDLSIDQ